VEIGAVVRVVVGVISPRFSDMVFNGESVGINVVFCVVMGISPRCADIVGSVSPRHSPFALSANPESHDKQRGVDRSSSEQDILVHASNPSVRH